MPRLSGSSSSIISIARTFGAPDTVPAGKARHERVDPVMPVRQFARHVRDDVHDLAIIFEEETIGDAHTSRFGDAPTSLRPEIQQHEVFGAFLVISEQIIGMALILCWGFAARTGSGDRTDRDLAPCAGEPGFPGLSQPPRNR